MQRVSFILTAVAMTVGVTARGQGFCRSIGEVGPSHCDQMPTCCGSSAGRLDRICSPVGCDPVWEANAGALFLSRDNPDDGVVVLNTVTPSEALRGEDYDFGEQVGFELGISRRIGRATRIEGRYFGIDHWTATASEATTSNDLLRFNASVPIFALSGDAIDSRLTSELHNAEINLSHDVCDWLRFLVGFRYLELDERSDINLVNPAVPVDYSARASNRLYGAQLGGDAALYSDDLFNLDVVGRAGIYGNHSSHAATITSGVATRRAVGSGSPTAFVGEIGVNGAAWLLECLSVRAGYGLLWLDGVAEASDQLAATDFNIGAGYNGSGDVFYHGAFVGLQLAH